MNSTVSKEELEELLKEHLESDLICRIAEYENVDAKQALDIYYKSKLSYQISDGVCGIQYLDAGYLFADLLENEPEILR